MTKPYRITVRVAELRSEPNSSPCGLYQLGDEFDISELEERAKICRWAFNAMFPFLVVLEFGGTLPWEPDPDRAFVSCPDPHNVVVFEIIRRRDE